MGAISKMIPIGTSTATDSSPLTRFTLMRMISEGVLRRRTTNSPSGDQRGRPPRSMPCAMSWGSRPKLRRNAFASRSWSLAPEGITV